MPYGVRNHWSEVLRLADVPVSDDEATARRLAASAGAVPVTLVDGAWTELPPLPEAE